MPESSGGLSRREQHAILVMARWAQAARWRRLRWSIPNDASWPPEHLAGIEVFHDGMPDQFELVGRRGWRSECVVATMWRTDTGPDVTGVPHEEWFRPSYQFAAGGEAVAHRRLHEARDPVSESWNGVLLHEPPPSPLRRRSPRPQARAAAAALVLAIPAGVTGVMLTNGGDDGGTRHAAVAGADSPITAAQVPPMPAGAADWASQARLRLASMDEKLDALAEAEDVWSSVPVAERAGSPPAELERLQAVRAQLIADRAELQRRLTAFEGLQRSRETLQAVEQRLAQLRSGTVPAEPDAAGQLRAEANRLATQAAQARQQVDSLRRAVQVAAADPLPPPEPVEPVAEAVLALTTHPGNPVDPGDPGPDRPDASVVAEPESESGPEPVPDVTEDVPADESTSGDIAARIQACAAGKGISGAPNASSDEQKLAALRAARDCFAQVYSSVPAADREAFEADAEALDEAGR